MTEQCDLCGFIDPVGGVATDPDDIIHPDEEKCSLCMDAPNNRNTTTQAICYVGNAILKALAKSSKRKPRQRK